MSREVLGDAPLFHGSGDVTAATPKPSSRPSTVDGSGIVDRFRAPSRTTAGLLITVLLLITAGAGWLGYGYRAAGATRTGDHVVAGVVSGYSLSGDDEQPLRARLAITVINAGPDDAVIGAAVDDGRLHGSFRMAPSSTTVRAGAGAPMSAEVRLDCDVSPALELPPLQLSLAGGRQRLLPVVGVLGTAFRLCAEGAPARRPVTMTSERIEGDRLVVAVAAPTGQPLQIDAVRAGGVLLTGRDQTVALSRTPTQLTLTSPAACPPAWATTGIPTSLSVDVRATPGGTDAAGRTREAFPSSIRLPSASLARWILAGPCGAPDA